MALPAKCYTISTGRHTPTTCVPGQTAMDRRTTEDTTFMLNYMTHNYIDPVQVHRNNCYNNVLQEIGYSCTVKLCN